MELIGIVASTANRVIGNKGKLPWHLPRDLRHFKELTLGNTLIIGRTTYEGIKKLPGRNIIVMTTQKNWKAKDVHVAHSVQKALEIAERTPDKKAFVGGGQRVYEQFWNMLDAIELTLVHGEYEGDSFCPPIPKGFRLLGGTTQAFDDCVWGRWVKRQ